MGGMPMISEGIRKAQPPPTARGSSIALLRWGFFAFFLMAVFAASGNAQEAEIEFFEKKIRPVLIERCYKCHSTESKKLKGKLLLDTREGLLKGGESGPAIVAGKPEKSLLISALRYEDLEMPPKNKLSDAVINDFILWIKKGAADPRDGVARKEEEGINVEQARREWPYSPLVKTPPPTIEGAEKLAVIDRHIIGKLKSKKLEPAKPADPRSLIRRLHFDLIGLPPSPGKIEKFAADPSRKSYEALVDELLDSPRFGERWGRHWLDVARYSDSTGGGRTRPIENAWRYRDYVIRGLNNDKPFDRFIREQIAGDLLPHKSDQERRENLIASGFLMLGPHNYENQDKDLLKLDVVDEQIDTIGRSLMGMTIGCARCHDHKFDPIPTADYYALTGIFMSTKLLILGNVASFIERPLPVPGALEKKAKEAAANLKTLEKELAGLKSEEKKLRGKNSAGAVAVKSLPGIVVDDPAADKAGDWIDSTFNKPYLGKGYIHDGDTSKGVKFVTFNVKLPRTGNYQVNLAYTPGTNRSPAVPVDIHHADGVKSIKVNQMKRAPIEGLFIPLGRFRFEKEKPAIVVISNKDTRGHVIVDGLQFIEDGTAKKPAAKKPTEKKGGKDQKAKNSARLKKIADDIKKLNKKIAAVKKNQPKVDKALSIEEHPKPADSPIHIRGEVRNLGPKVPRGFLSILPTKKPTVISDKESGRLQLAEWISSNENPLTPRVAVNRIWHHLFGAGLVRTPDNFGKTGEKPSHPGLLDYLARRFIEQGWSRKKIIREILVSNTYRQSTRYDPAVLEIDPENRLLSHASRRRLDAESLRDSILHCSGELDLTPGGPAIASKGNGPVAKKIEYSYDFKSTRRSIYVPVFRNTLLDIFEVFDFADPNISSGSRATTTRPTQALFLLNSPFMIDRSVKSAEFLLKLEELDDAGRLERAYLRILSRPPDKKEISLATDYLKSHPYRQKTKETEIAAGRLEAWAGLCQALLSCNDFRYLK
jgi:hypothetical protein